MKGFKGGNSISNVSPFLKWAGGKRWLMEQYPEFSPKAFGRYFEPFLGGASVFFKLKPERATLSDLNPELISAYEAIRDEPIRVERALHRLGEKHSKEHYYQVRASEPASKVERAARFLYLNRTCWNGLYRVNRLGKFNVPIGSKSSVMLPADDFLAVSKILKNVSFRCCDFSSSISRSKAGDFVYCDPPYTVRHNNNGFLKYNEAIFSWMDQIRLAQSLRRASDRGVQFVVSNANHASVLDLYKDFNVTELRRSSVISGSIKGRGIYDEILVSNF